MLSSIYLAGSLGENVEKGIRIVEVESYIPGKEGFVTQRIPVLCRLLPGSYFFTAPKGSLVIVKGRLENHEKYGLVVVNEIDEIFSNKSHVTKTAIREE